MIFRSIKLAAGVSLLAMALAVGAVLPASAQVTAVPREIRPNRHGAYRTEIVAGEYYVVASTEARADWDAPKSLAELANTATRITITAGERKTQDITIRH